MSRYVIPQGDPTREVIVGFDQGLQTFFGQVIALDAPLEVDHVLFWVGVAPYGVPTVERLQALMQEYVTLTAFQVMTLRQDQATRPALTEVQQMMLEFLEDHQP